MRIVAFEPHYNERHRTVLRALAASIGAEVRDMRDYEPCDVAIVFGACKHSYPPTWPKGEILKRHTGRSLLMVESAFVRRGDYWAIGWGGFAGNADFNLSGDEPMDRWESFGIPSKPWRRNEDGPVVVCGQLPRDTQVQDVNHVQWCRQTLAQVRALGYPSLFRPHPRCRDPEATYGIPASQMDLRKMKHTIAEARVFVTWNSTSCVDALVAGVPAITCHPSSIGWPVSRHDVLDIDRPWYPSRRQWLSGMGYSQWSLDEIERGLPWAHLTREETRHA